MFQGDIAQFAPADLLLFLSHMNKEGVLTVRQDDASLSLSFRRNLIVDAGCEAAEDLILEMLVQHEAAGRDTLDGIPFFYPLATRNVMLSLQASF